LSKVQEKIMEIIAENNSITQMKIAKKMKINE